MSFTHSGREKIKVAEKCDQKNAILRALSLNKKTLKKRLGGGVINVGSSLANYDLKLVDQSDFLALK